MDFLEKQILAKRDELDQIERVDEGLLWQNIQSDLSPPQKKIARRYTLLQVYAVAASVALLAMVSYLFLQKGGVNINEPALIVEDYIPDFDDKENYIKTVSQKEKELNLSQIDRSKYKDIFYELEILEEIHNEFRSDLPTISDEEKKIEILQKYYERKIRILEQLSKEIEKKSHYEKRINEKPM